MLYKAIRRPDGRHIVLDPDYFAQTTKIVDNDRDYDLAVSQGWCGHPTLALARLDEAENALSTDAAVRAYDDRHLSEAAQTEAAVVESTTLRHLPAIPEGPKKRGRPRKVQ